MLRLACASRRSCFFSMCLGFGVFCIKSVFCHSLCFFRPVAAACRVLDPKFHHFFFIFLPIQRQFPHFLRFFRPAAATGRQKERKWKFFLIWSKSCVAQQLEMCATFVRISSCRAPQVVKPPRAPCITKCLKRMGTEWRGGIECVTPPFIRIKGGVIEQSFMAPITHIGYPTSQSVTLHHVFEK